jgi:hypothetical protein
MFLLPFVPDQFGVVCLVIQRHLSGKYAKRCVVELNKNGRVAWKRFLGVQVDCEPENSLHLKALTDRGRQPRSDT